ncbi:MAG: 6-phosphogluconate dehydrogenase (decarboxylating), partial [Euryarchaeota archaeon]|nr:6-phosphogluconate dehydrogenase (decarboxylating) [Euryarchaeota archaeon]
RGDFLVDGGNSFYKDTVRRAKRFEAKGIGFADAGVSGGPEGARHGACIMAGGDSKAYVHLEPLFRDLAAPSAYARVGEAGAGHFAKMVHNGIEYGMMQAIAEGFSIIKKSRFKIALGRIADLFNHRSVIESRLVGWLVSAYEEFGEDLKGVSGSVRQTGEGKWTARAAR